MDLAASLAARYLQVTVYNPSGADLYDYPVRIRLNTSNFGDWASMGPSGVFFLEGTGKAEPLYYWVEWLDLGSRDMLVWVRVPFIPAGGSASILMGYNTSVNPYPEYNDPQEIFIFYDGAEDGVAGSSWGYQVGNGVVTYGDVCVFQGSLGLFKNSFNDPNGARKTIGTSILRSEGVVALEFWVYRPDPWSGGPVDSVGIVRGVGDGYGWAYDHNADNLYIEVRDDYSLDGTLDNTANDPPEVTNSWVRGVLYISPNGTVSALRYSFDDTLLNIVQGVNTTFTVFDSVYILGGYEYCVDDIIVRKAAPIEPHASLSSTPSTLSIITLYPKNTGETPLNLSWSYVRDLSTKTLVLDQPLQQTLLPGQTGKIQLIIAGGSGFYEVIISTSQGVKARALVSSVG